MTRDKSEAKIEFDFDKPTEPPVANPLSGLLETKDSQIRALSAYLANVLSLTGEPMGGGGKAKDRCIDCGPRFTHGLMKHNCPCVCHEARAYLTELTK